MSRTVKGQAAYDAYITHEVAINGVGDAVPAVVIMANNYADGVEVMERLENLLAAGGPLQTKLDNAGTALTTVLSRAAAIKAKTDNLP